jgi:hypothetical protein
LSLVVLGDLANLSGLVTARLAGPSVGAPLPPPEDVPSETLYRSARELLTVLPAEQPADPVGLRLWAQRDLFKAQALELAPEYLVRSEALAKGELGGCLDGKTVAYLGLSDAYFLASRAPDKAPALLLLLKAIEHELDVHLLGRLRAPLYSARARAVVESHPDSPYARFLLAPPRPYSLEEIDGLLWSMLTATDRPVKALVRLARRATLASLGDPMLVFDPSRLPLRIDQIYKKFFLRLDKQTWDWESVRKAREEILGPRQENVFQQIARGLGKREVKAAAAEAPRV